MMHNRPATLHMDGVEWIEKAAYDALREKLMEKQRSLASHGRYFAEINNMFENLPLVHADAPYSKSADAFRKFGLIQRGYCDVETISLESHEDALRVAPFIADLARKAHGFALTIVRGDLVICSTPHSQSFKAMGKDKFHESVAAVEDWAAGILGVKE